MLADIIIIIIIISSSTVVCHFVVVLKKALRFPPTPVPTDKNTHMCLGINLPDDITVYDQLPVGVEPVLDNTVIMHHMNLWGCAEMPRNYSCIFHR